MSISRYDGNGLKLLTKEVDGIIKQLKATVNLQLRSAETAQEACLQITKAVAENPDAKTDISSFLTEACQSYKNMLLLKEDIAILNHYREVIEQYQEIVRNNCDTYALLSNEEDFFDELSADVKDKVCRAIQRNSYKKTNSLIHLMYTCGEELQ